ncbi:MAG: hypothetical protein IT364_19440 [Candidatus Hydrogenedentes bacterium]|nr:hypothetical protein [Candidatus Hydrogenedentota bacterium]
MKEMFRHSRWIVLLVALPIFAGCPLGTIHPQLVHLTPSWPVYFYAPGSQDSSSVWPQAMAVMENGDWVVAGRYTRGNTLSQSTRGVFVMRTDAQGQLLWWKNEALTVAITGACRIREESDGGLTVVRGATKVNGTSWMENDAQLVIEHCDADGGGLSYRVIDVGPKRSAGALELLANGNFLVAGRSSGSDGYISEINDLGEVQWTATLAAAEWVEFAALAEVQVGYVAVGDRGLPGDAAGYEGYAVKVDQQGETVWTQTYSLGHATTFSSVRETEDGGLILAGLTNDSSYTVRSTCAVKTDELGDVEWTVSLGGNPGLNIPRVVENPGVGYLVGSGFYNTCLWQLDGAGQTVWSTTLPVPLFFEEIAPLSDHGCVVVGFCAPDAVGDTVFETFMPVAQPMFLARFDATGQLPQ